MRPRALQRRLERLAVRNEATIASDKRFFERRPDRQYRLRLASVPEVELDRALRLSAIAGLMGLGVLQAWLGLHRAILVCSAFFFIAVVIVLFVDEERGKRTARAHAGE